MENLIGGKDNCVVPHCFFRLEEGECSEIQLTQDHQITITILDAVSRPASPLENRHIKYSVTCAQGTFEGRLSEWDFLHNRNREGIFDGFCVIVAYLFIPKETDSQVADGDPKKAFMEFVIYDPSNQ